MKSHLLLFFLAFFSLKAQTLSYSILQSTNGASPSARVDGTIAYDPTGRQIFMFGGQDSQGSRNDLWSYSLADRSWTQIDDSRSATRPQPRFGHTLVLDSARRRLILFGGQAGGFFSDVWAFDIAVSTWQQLSRDDAGPSRRYGHSAIYESARDRMVVSHGFTNAGRFDDTWAFDLTNSTWRNISPSSGRPLRRCLHHAVYNAAGGEMLLYGGCSSGSGPCPQADLWSFDLANNRWTERTPRVSPPGREHYGFAFDGPRSRAVLFGGSGNSGLLSDSWEYDPQARTWQSAAIEGNPPSPRSRHQGVAAPDLNATFFFGGTTASGLTNELWTLGPVQPRPVPVISSIHNTFSGEAGAVAPGEIITIFGSSFGITPGDIRFGDFDTETGKLPSTVAGVTVNINGIAAPIYLVTGEEIRLQVPYEIATSTEARIIVAAGQDVSEPVTLHVVPTRPGLLQGDRIVATPGSLIELFATGQGVTSPESLTGARPQGEVFPEPVAPVTLTIGGRELEILSRGQAPDAAGIIRIVARIPNDFTPDLAAAVILTIGGANSQTGFTITVLAPE